MKITLPNQWTPRPYQVEVFRALDSGIKRVITVWHRRSGKDSASFNYIVKAAHQRVGNYWHLFPTARQGRKALWDAIDISGRRVIDQAAPLVIRESTRNDEMLIKLKCGSTIQVTGADQADSLVGSNPVGVVFSEYALTSPVTWRFVEPILIQNKGWAWFNSTPRGRNHLFELFERNKVNPDWLCSIKGWRDTGVITEEDIEAAVRSGMPREVAEQEFNCSFNAPNVGVVYAHQLARAKAEGRIGHVPYDARLPVETWWDPGSDDATAIWFVQHHPLGGLNFIRYLEERNRDLPYFAQELGKLPYHYSRHVGPHDLEQRVWAIAGSKKSIAEQHGIWFTVAPKLSIADGIEASRTNFSRFRFDAENCQVGLAALGHYQFEWDEDKRIFGDKPVHDWSSHGADALRTGSVTPEGIGLIPDWARPLVGAQPWQPPQAQLRGHPGGLGGRGFGMQPTPQTPDLDPLGEWR